MTSSTSTLRPPALAPAGSRSGAALSRFLFFILIAAVFFASGAAGLIYQVAWVRILSLIFGVTVHAVSTVLAGFMAGLALGSFFAGRIAERVRNPFLVYGLVECGIGATGLLTPWAFGRLRAVYPSINRWIEEAVPALVAGGAQDDFVPGALRLVIAFIILLVPTTLMGATLPVMLKSSLIRGSSLGGSVSVLYAINTFGAIAGTVGAGFFLIGDYGVRASINTAAAINLGVGVVALLASLVIGSGAARRGSTRADPVSRSAVPDEVLTRRVVVLVAFLVSGLCGLAFEVVWTRLLSLFSKDNSTYGFTLMLAMVLFGIAAGSYVISPLAGALGRRLNWWVIFALLELGIGLAAVLSITVLSNLPAAVALVSTWPGLSLLATNDDGFMILSAFAAIVPSMFLSGMTFPAAAQIYAADRPDAARRVGTLYAANVLGAIAGSLLAGFYLLPHFASQRSLTLLSLGSVGAAALVLWAAPRVHVVVKLALTALGAVAFVFAVRSAPDLAIYLNRARFPDQDVVWYREGLESSVTLVRDKDSYITLFTNSRGQARDEPALVAFHRLLAHYPMLLNPNPQRALIVGIGGGTTSGAVAIHPGVHLDAVELSDAVIAAVKGSEEFGRVNYRFWELPNVTLRQGDARNHLLTSGQKYHVISGDAIRPNDAGATTLYSVEYYQLCAAALEDDGLMAQWIPPFSDFQYKLIIRTFLAAFPYATLWQDGDLIIGSKSPIKVDRAALERRFADSRLQAELAKAGLPSAAEMLTHYNASEDELRRVVGDGPIITDDRPYIEFFRNLPVDEPPNMKVYSRDVRQVLR
jgi:spermidine synthase